MNTQPSVNGVNLDAELAQLLLEQEQFFSQKKQPSARVLHRGDVPIESSPASLNEVFRSLPEEGVQVLKGVVERKVASGSQQSFKFDVNSTGFPVVSRRGPSQSLFGRRRREMKTQEKKKEEEREIQLSFESRNIDAANRAKLQEMSAQEILEAQQELLKSLDPKLVEKLKNRGIKKKEEKVKKEVGKTKVAIGESILKKEQLQKERLITKLAAVKTMEELKEQERLLSAEERAKLDWTQSTPKNRILFTESVARSVEEPSLERFDLDGKALQATDADLPVHSGLFHHGKNPKDAGYTLPELLHLARSSVASQRAMALSIVTKILHNRQLQTLESRSVSPRVLPRDIAVTLRMVLDDQNYTALSAGISALHAFIVPIEVDENCCLTELAHGLIVFPSKIYLHRNEMGKQARSRLNELEKVVYIDTTEVDDGTSISAEDLAVLDPVQALLHMDLGSRVHYILESIKLPDQDATAKIIDILIAVARHSPRAAHKISSNSRLLQLLQRKYIENEQVLTFQTENVRALQLSLKTLKLVRVLCQGQRSVASELLTNGLIQSTKGFLALEEVPTGDVNEETSMLFERLQVESLRIWRILLGYGLDFHCFAYLFPIFLKLLQHATNARKVALFAALETFCALESMHEAQHYFSQLNYFVDVAKDEAIACFLLLLKSSELRDLQILLLLATTLRFLSAASCHAEKYDLDTAAFVQVLELVQSTEVLKLLPRLSETIESREVLVAILRSYVRIIRNDCLCKNTSDHNVRTFLHKVKEPLLVAATVAVASSANMDISLIQACELVVLVEDLDTVQFEATFVQAMYDHAFTLIQRLESGGEYWITRLFAGVLFHPVFLQLLGVFSNNADATRMSRVLLPVYQALVNATRKQEIHSTQLFSPISGVHKISSHLHLPQEEQTYTASNLPLPNFWVVSPLSSIEFKSSSGNCTDATPPQSEEMKLIVSATCRFVFGLEQLASSMATVPLIAKLSPEDKFFHLLHVFFTGSDVLFDDNVNFSLQQLLSKLIMPLFHPTSDEKLLSTGLVRNLKRNQTCESFDETPNSFASDERQLLTFVEKLLAEYTASSFGNLHFAQCVTLLLMKEFSFEVRHFVWKELLESHLLHTLAPFQMAKAEIFKRCTQNGNVKLLQLMQQAVCKSQISPVRGDFAYTIAIHHLVVYMFAENDRDTLSVARQHLAQTLLMEATPAIWGHLLSYDVASKSLLSEMHDAIRPERVTKVRSQASFSSDQLLVFDATVSLLRH